MMKTPALNSTIVLCYNGCVTDLAFGTAGERFNSAQGKYSALLTDDLQIKSINFDLEKGHAYFTF